MSEIARNTVGHSARQADTEGAARTIERHRPTASDRSYAERAPYRYPTKDARSNKKLGREVVILESRRLLFSDLNCYRHPGFFTHEALRTILDMPLGGISAFAAGYRLATEATL